MPLETNRLPFVIGLDGLHRIGKGTQASMLQAAINNGGGKSIVLRGDGTRDGLGLSDGDPCSEEWQLRNRQLKSSEGNTIEGWNTSSYLLMQELNEIKTSNTEYDALIIDRTALSRVAFLLHRGVAPEGTRLTVDEMYPDNINAGNKSLNLAETLPDIIFDLQSATPTDLLARLDDEDPKYAFRARNIRDGFNAATIAKVHLPKEIEQRVVTLDAARDIESMHASIRACLAKTAINNFLS